MKKITREAYLKGRDKSSPLTREQEQNLETLLEKLNQLQELWGDEFVVTSGYRPPLINSGVGGAKKSAHITCQAADLSDPSGLIGKWLEKNVDVLEDCGLYLEDPSYTQGWCHVQTRPTSRRIFLPYAKKG